MSALLVRPLQVALVTGPPGALEAMYRATGLSAELLADPDARIEPDQLRRAWKEAVRLTGKPQLALEIAAACPPGAFGIVEYLARTAPTLGEAMALGVRYLNLIDEVVEAELVAGDAPDQLAMRIVVESAVPPEACFGAVVAHARALCDGFRPVAVELSHRPDGDLGAYERFFDAPVRFGAPHARMVMSRASLDRPLASADPNLLPILIRHAEDLLARRRAAPAVTAQVRRVLCELLRAGRADVEHVAARLGVTSRSLQRRLRDEGTSFHAVRDELRRELAASYLESRLSISEISFLLGFSEASVFFRAFKRWTGMTPQEARRANAA